MGRESPDETDIGGCVGGFVGLTEVEVDLIKEAAILTFLEGAGGLTPNVDGGGAKVPGPPGRDKGDGARGGGEGAFIF